MGKRELSKEQLAAARLLTRNVALTAGAGTGKTSTLVERFVTILKGRWAAVRQIAAITFTEKAANELKSRVHQALRELADAESDPVSRQAWRKDLIALEMAEIGTIHSFCARILREFCAEADLDPGFSVMEEVQSRMLVSSVVRDTLFSAVHSGDGATLRLLGAYEFAALAAMLEGALARRAEMSFACGLLSLGDGDAARVAARLKELTSAAAIDATSQHIFSLKFQSLVSVLEQAKGPEGDALDDKRRAFLRAHETMRSCEAGQLQSAISAMHEPLKNLRGAGKDWDDATLANAKKTMEKAREILKEAQADFEAVSIENWGERAREALDFTHLYDMALEQCKLRKRRSALVDFDDLIISARDLVISNDAVAQSLADRHEFILVDEFQDTDYAQSDMIQAVAAKGSNLFVVGDREQSIYGFRGARIEVFSRLIMDFAESGTGKVMRLSENHRSLGHIMAFVNALFARLMPPGSKTPWRVSHEPLRSDRHGGGDRVEIILGKSDEGISRARRVEAQAVARRIKEIVGSGQPLVRDARENCEGVWRAATYADFAILFRSMSDVDIYERELQAAGIRFYTIAGATFYLRQEVKDLINALRFIVDESDSLSLVGALRSPLFAVSDNCLALVARSRPIADYFNGEPPPANEGADFDAFRRAAALIGRLRDIAGRVSIREVIDTILDETSFCGALAMLDSGRQRVANVLKLRDAAGAFDRSTGGSLREFVNNVSLLELGGAREGEAPIEDEKEDVVRLMTIHAAKGLEFPIVVVADMGRARNRGGRGGGQVIQDRQIGLALPGAGDDRSSCYEIARKLAAAREEEEETRILYVAATRARDHLILSGAVSGGHGKPADRPEGWIAAALGALEIDHSQSGVHRLEGFTVDFACAAAPPAGRRHGKSPLLTLHEPIVSGGDLPRPKRPDEAEILARSAPVAAAGSAVRRRFTATELADFMRCGLRYELLHLRGLPADFILSESRASERPPGHVVGSLLHEVIEKARGREGLSAALDRVIASNAAYAPIASALRRECAPILERFEKTALGARILSPDARREKQFSFLLDEYLLEGKIDALAGGDIVDFKSDDIEPSEAAAHAEAYRSQMDLYALACERLTGKAPERVVLYFLRPGIEVAWNYGAAGLEAAASRVRETIGLIQNGPPYVTAAGDACRCEYQTLCRFIARRRATR